jgi:hypothetical protein
MNRLASTLKSALQIAIFGIVLAVSKRKAKWLFWPLYFFATWAILPYMLLFFIFLVQVFVFDLLLGVKTDIFDSDYAAILVVVFHILSIKTIWNVIEFIELEFFGDIEQLSFGKRIIGFLYGAAINTFLLYRIGFFEEVF